MLWIVAGVCFEFRIRGSLLMFLCGWLLVLISMLSIGMLVGGIAKNAKQASIIASILYFPMLIFSGATLPYEVMPKTLQVIVDFMPLTQGIKILKATLLGLPLEGIWIAVTVMVTVAAVCIGLSIKCFQWE